jgi:hypothetical protein
MDEPLTKAAAWKYGFLLRCAQEGLDGAAVSGRIAAGLELASTPAKSAGVMGAIGDALKLGLGAAGALSVIVPAGVGATGGYLAHKLTTPELDLDAIRDRELIDAYDAYAHEAKTRALAARYRPKRKPSFAAY